MRARQTLAGLRTSAIAAALIGAAATVALGAPDAARTNAPANAPATIPPARDRTADGPRDAGAGAANLTHSYAVESDAGAWRLGRAVVAWRSGDLRAVIENLEAIDFAVRPSFEEPDRAAFLLGQAYRRLGMNARFEQLARAVAGWNRESTYTRWLAFQLELTNAASGVGNDAKWMRIASDTTTQLGRDRAGAESIRRATETLAKGGDPRAALESVPRGSKYASAARHLGGLAAIERGDADAGESMLEALLADTTYGARREVRLALAGRALERASWAIALEHYEGIERDWARNRDALDRMLARGAYDDVWSMWETNAAPSDAWMLDARGANARAQALADASVNLTARGDVPVPALDAPERSGSTFVFPFALPAPSEAEWTQVAGAARQVDEAGGDLTRVRWERDAERERLERTRRYLGAGRERAAQVTTELAARAARLDSLRRTLDALDARIRSVRDAATRRVLERAARVIEQSMNDVLWTGGIRHFHLDGPHPARTMPAPAGQPEPDSVLRAEEGLARRILAQAQDLAAKTPDLIARSYEQAWRPGLIDRARRQANDAARTLAWARRLTGSLDSSIAANATSPAMRRLTARVTGLEHRVDSLSAVHRDLRASVARAAVTRARAALGGEREAIDYGLAAATYGLGVRLAAPSAEYVAPVRAMGDSSVARDANELDAPALVQWRGQAIVAARNFLSRHPGSDARGEVRFRLADLLLIEERRAFNARMADYMKAQAEHRAAGAPPVLSHEAPLALYRAILAEDPAFEHRDAVRFNAAMILADQGDPAAEALLADLVREHPGSDYFQEANLRLGDMRFDAQQYTEAIALYERAAAGPDAGLTAIALYKTGWSHYDENRFAEAAEAFRAVLDLQASKPNATAADLEDEAEAYLVHSIAGAGGARAFAQHFDRVGARPYESRVLLALGQNFRRLGLHADAAAVDELFVERYPRHPDALLSAQRLIESRRRATPGTPVTEARLAQAPRFAPASEWFQAQQSDSVRTAGAEFARSSWTIAARAHHKAAQKNGTRAHWQTALDTYHTLLDRWPNDPAKPAIALSAGEAAAALGDHRLAMEHYATASAGRDSVARIALWQRVAVADAWYASTRKDAAAAPGTSRAPALGSDSLAHVVLDAADALTARFPNHPQAAELLWRQGNLSFAHGWYDRAANDFGRLATRHPNDRYAVRAAALRADALYRGQNFDGAAAAYEEALVAAKIAGVDSLAQRTAKSIPISHYRHAEAMVAADSTRHEQHAALFEKLARGWPHYEHAHLAQYRAGLAYFAAKKTDDGVAAMEAVIDHFPSSPYVRDAHLHVAQAWKQAGKTDRAAEAYAKFAARYRDDESAHGAWLEAAELFSAAGLPERAEQQQLAYLEAFPNDAETAMEILEPLARRDLATVGPERSLATLLPPAAAAKAAKGTKAASAKAAAPSHLAAYLKRAEANPKLASPSLLAQVRFLEAEESYAAYGALRLKQPLAKSIAAKHKSLDQTLALYRRSVDLGATEWAHASAYRMGEMIVAFGDALERSDRPADLKGDDLLAYEEVLREKAQPYHDRGEGVWRDLLEHRPRDAARDAWIDKTEAALWQRLGTRFFYRPETEFPLVTAPMREIGASESDREQTTAGGTSGADVRREDDER